MLCCRCSVGGVIFGTFFGYDIPVHFWSWKCGANLTTIAVLCKLALFIAHYHVCFETIVLPGMASALSHFSKLFVCLPVNVVVVFSGRHLQAWCLTCFNHSILNIFVDLGRSIISFINYLVHCVVAVLMALFETCYANALRPKLIWISKTFDYRKNLKKSSLCMAKLFMNTASRSHCVCHSPCCLLLSTLLVLAT